MRSNVNNLFHLLVKAAEENPDYTFFIYNNKKHSYRDILKKTRKFANFLRKRGIEGGDRILLYIGNTPEFIYAYFAAVQLGVISILVNPATKRHELKYYLDETDPKIVISSSQQLENFKIDDESLYNPENIILIDGDGNENDLNSIIENEEPYNKYEELEPVYPTSIIFTSAMDGYPLGAMIDHRAILETAKATSSILIGDSDIFLTALPLFHSFGLTSSLFIPLYNQVPFYLLKRFSPKKLLEIISSYDITVFCGVPLMFHFLDMVMEESMEFPKMRVWVSGGESISVNLQTRFKQKYNIEIRQGYGLTEASPIVTWNLLGRTNKFGSIGLPMPYNDVQIITDGRFGKPGDIGEIIAKGVNVITGYYKRMDKTKEFIIDGWLHTGDIGTTDEEGYFYISDRKKDMILKGGFNVYPKEVEKILRYHPDVSEVQVIGHIQKRDDSSRVESIEAIVYRKKGKDISEKSFLNWCKENISSYKIPDIVQIK
jgi:long-chain acyl-CoA synthetase